MPIKIGHSSIDENGCAKNGRAGDQTNKEVCIRDWYSKPWDLVLRCKDRNIAEKMASECEKGCNNPCIGYDQNQRNTLRTQAKLVGMDLSRIRTDCECDCSSFMSVCAECAGIKIPYNCTNAPTTSTMKNAFTSTGMFDVLTDSKYLTTDKYLLRGDILVKAGCHTVMALENGSCVVEKPKKNYIYGIDVSEAQGIIDFNKVKNAGKQFVCMRTTKKSLNPDKYFERNLQECIEKRLDYSGFKYCYATTVDQARREADSVINLFKGRHIPIWYDIEDNILKSLGKAGIEKIAFAFITECGLAGLDVGIYCSDSWYKTYISDALKKSYLFWGARYGKNDGTLNENYPLSFNALAWQYTDKGRCNGINGYVDLDVML